MQLDNSFVKILQIDSRFHFAHCTAKWRDGDLKTWESADFVILILLTYIENCGKSDDGGGGGGGIALSMLPGVLFLLSTYFCGLTLPKLKGIHSVNYEDNESLFPFHFFCSFSYYSNFSTKDVTAILIKFSLGDFKKLIFYRYIKYILTTLLTPLAENWIRWWNLKGISNYPKLNVLVLVLSRLLKYTFILVLGLC